MKNNRKEDLQIGYMQAICVKADISFDIQRHDDDSTDAILKKRIFLSGICYDASFRIQLKCTASRNLYNNSEDVITYKLKAKNYNDLCIRSTTPIVLGLLILPEDSESWMNWSEEELLIHGTMYWENFSFCEPTNNKNTVTVKIRKKKLVSPESLIQILERIAKGEKL